MRNIILKKPFIFFLILVIFVGCKKSESDKIEIEFWTLQLSPLFNNYFNDIISKYEKEHTNIKIRWIDIPYDAVIQKLLASLSADDAPDVVNLSSDFLSKFNNLKTLLDLNTQIKADYFEQFLPNALESNKFKNKIIGLPWYQNTYALIYNKRLLNSAGYSDNDLPKTFFELINFTKKYKDITGKYALFCNLGKDSFLPMILESEGVSLTNKDMTKSTFNTTEGEKVITAWVNLYKEGYLQSESLIKPGSSLIEAYQSGQVAMVFTGPVFLKRVKDNAPNIYKATDIAPAIVGKTGNHELAGMSISVMATTKHPVESTEFLKYVVEAENQLKFSKLASIYPSTKASLKNEYFIKEDGTLETKARVLGASQISSAIRLSKYLLHPKFDLLKQIFEEEIQSACLNKISVKEAMNRISTEWDNILQQN